MKIHNKTQPLTVLFACSVAFVVTSNLGIGHSTVHHDPMSNSCGIKELKTEVTTGLRSAPVAFAELPPENHVEPSTIKYHIPMSTVKSHLCL